jgi:YHS domain-containing protein
MLLRLIIFLLLVYVFSKVFKKLFQKHGYIKSHHIDSNIFGGKNAKPVDEMVQDPICKVYIPKRDAITTVQSGTTYYFCSRECLSKFNTDNA